jgi:hypothetical protein
MLPLDTQSADFLRLGGLSDASKLLACIRSAELVGIEIDPENIGSVIYLLDADDTVPFSYDFHYFQTVRSTGIHEDVAYLKRRHAIVQNSPFSTTEKGRVLLREAFEGAPDFNALIGGISAALQEKVPADRETLLALVYNRL